jgi:hypothetical protein
MCLAVFLAFAGVIAALTISLQINSNQQISWAAKFAKSIVQDLFISPLLTLGLNYFALKCSMCGQRIKNLAKFLADSAVLEISASFKARISQPSSNVIYYLFQEKIWLMCNVEIEINKSSTAVSQ